MGNLYIHVCGTTRVVDDEGIVIDKLGGVKPRQVLEILALSLGRPVSKDRIADLLWDGAPPPSYVTTLESYVCLLRRLLGIKGRDSAIRTTTTGYLLRADAARVDVLEARDGLLTAARTADPDARAVLVDEAIELLRGEMLASEPHAAWAQSHRASHERDVASWCAEASEAMYALGDTRLAWRLGRFVTERDPLSERAWQVQIKALAAEGRAAEALHMYSRLRAVMLEELGTTPSPESQRLYAELLRRCGDESRESTGGRELRALIRLLRQALEAFPGVRVPDGDEDLTRIAVRVLEVA